jgi:hypothetical protein
VKVGGGESKDLLLSLPLPLPLSLLLPLPLPLPFLQLKQHAVILSEGWPYFGQTQSKDLRPFLLLLLLLLLPLLLLLLFARPKRKLSS